MRDQKREGGKEGKERDWRQFEYAIPYNKNNKESTC